MPPFLTPLDLQMMARVTLAFVLGAVIGWERDRRGHPAGLRTHALVSAGAACFSLASLYGFALAHSAVQPGALAPQVDTSRVAAQIVSGIGFLGAGTIFRTPDSVRGLTTAATIWIVAAIGMLAGTGLVALAIFATFLVVITLTVLRVVAHRPARPIGEPSLVPDPPAYSSESHDAV